MIIYNKLWLLLAKKGMKKTDLELSPATIAKLSQNSNINTSTIEKICDMLDCQPADIMENVTEEKIKETSDKLTEQVNILFNMLEMTTGKTRKEIVEETKNNMPDFIENMKKNNFDFSKMLETYKSQNIDKK